MSQSKVQKIFATLSKKIRFEPIINKLARKNATAFEILIATMMSARTKDEVTELAAERLFREYNTPQILSKVEQKKIEALIYPVGFYKTKAENIIDISRILISDHKSKVPNELNELTKLPGVGLKTAALVLAEAFGMDEICVDTHVHRISNRLDLVRTKTPEDTYKALKRVLPREYWRKINFFFVSYGKTVCTPISPKCSICSIFKYCPKRGVETSR